MSFDPIPKADVEASELMDELIEVTNQLMTDTLTLRRLENRAKSLAKANVQIAHTVLGAIAAFRFQATAVERHFRIARQNADNPVLPMVNHSVALQYLEKPEASVSALEKVLVEEPGDPHYLDMAMRGAMDAGHFRDAYEYCQRYNAAKPQEKNPLSDRVAEVVAALDAGAFTESAVQKVIALGCRIQQDHKILRKRALLGRDRDMEHGFTVHKPVSATPALAADMNVELAEAWVEDESLSDDPGFNFTLLYVAVEGA